MKKSLSLLVAIAMVFSMFAAVASAAETTKTTEQKYEELVAAGIFSGMDDGKPHLDKNMTRAQAARIIAVITGFEKGTEVKDAGYTDLKGAGWAEEYINYATEIGVLAGKGNNKFDPSADVTVQQLAVIVTKLAELAKTELPAGEAVEGKVDEWAAKHVASVVAAGILVKHDDYTVAATRGLLVDVVYEAKQMLEEANAEVTANAVGAKKIEVKFNKAVDESKVALTVKKGTISVNVSNKVFSEDKKTVVLETASKLTAGEYTVSVTGVADEAIVAKFTAENEKVAKIEFLSDKAPMKALPSQPSDNVTLEIPYKVLNNYGENVTKTTSLSSNIAGAPTAAKALVEVVGPYRINDAVTVSLIHPETATSVVQTFTVVAPARVAEVSIDGLYNKDGKSLDDSADLDVDLFYLLVNGKDQYGNAVTKKDSFDADVIVSETNPTVVVAGSPFTTVEIDGVEKVALALKNPATAQNAKVGQSTITLISNTQGKSANFNVVVAETVRADVINMINPGDVYANEKAVIPVEVFDKQGNVITDVKVLNNNTKGVTVRVGSNSNILTNPFVAKDGGVQLEIPAGSVSEGTLTVIAQTASYKVTNIILNVKAESVPTVIQGFKADFEKAYKTGSTGLTLKHSNLDVEDQHGRVMTNDQVKNWLSASNKIVVTPLDTDQTDVVFDDTEIVDQNGVTFEVGNANATAKFKIAIFIGSQEKASSAAEVTIQVTDGTQYVSYAVDTIGKVFDAKAINDTAFDYNSAYDKEVVVYGVLANKNKVKLSNDQFTVSALSNGTVQASIQNEVIKVTSALSGYGDKNEMVVPVTVTINSNGKTLTQDVTFSKEASKVVSVKSIEGTDVKNDARTSVKLSASTTQFDVKSLANATNSIVATDQYGVRVVANTTDGTITFPGQAPIAGSFVITPIKGSIKITDNGKFTAKVESTTAGNPITGAEFDVTVTYVGGQSVKVNVKVD